MRGNYYVYFVTNQRNGTLYVGVTNDLKRRIWEHKARPYRGLRLNMVLGRLVYFETFRDITGPEFVHETRQSRLSDEENHGRASAKIHNGQT